MSRCNSKAGGRWGLALACLGLAACPVAAVELGSGFLNLAGAGLTVAPEAQTVPFGVPTVVETHLQGVDAAGAGLGADGLGGLRVLADLTGPEIVGVLALETVPGEPFRIPSFSIEGEYRLENIRLVQGSEILSLASPQSATVRVTQILVTSVTSRPLSLDEIRQYGVVVDQDNFRAFQFTFGFGALGDTYSFDVPVIWRPEGTLEIPEAQLFGHEAPNTPGGQRFTPPQWEPFLLEPVDAGGDVAFGGCLEGDGDCSEEDPPPPLPGVILFPTEISHLHQFFSVVLMAQNGAPAGDVLRIRDLTGRLKVPPGLRAARTSPPTALGSPVPLRVPGPDGQLGTGDDLTFLVAQATGQADYVVEGLREGTHIVSFDLEGVLEGMPTGPRRIAGTARGAVIVRDPEFGILISHPDVVRRDEEYTLRLTVSNNGKTPANLVSVTLPANRLSGAQLADPNGSRREIPSLAPGESEVVEFRIRSLRTGRVVASSARAPGSVTPSFELFSAIGDAEIPLSPTEIVLPRAAEALPAPVIRQATGLLGLAYSSATAAPALVGPQTPLVTRGIVTRRASQLAVAGQTLSMGEDEFVVLSRLAAEWLGVRDGDTEWDLLRRRSRRGGQWGAELALTLDREIDRVGSAATFAGFVDAVADFANLTAVFASGAQPRLEILSRTSGAALSGSGLALDRVRALPFGDLWSADGAELAMVGPADAGGHELRLRNGGGAGSTSPFDLQVLVAGPPVDGLPGDLTIARWSSVSLATGDVAIARIGREGDSWVLSVDRESDGSIDEERPASFVGAPALRPFEVLAAVQNADLDPSGHVVDVLLSRGVDAASLEPAEPAHFVIADRVSNGGALLGSASSGAHLVRVVFDNPLAPFDEARLRASELRSLRQETLVNQELVVEARVSAPGIRVEGVVLGADALPVSGAVVELWESDLDGLTGECIAHRTAAVSADAEGRYRLPYVRQTDCGDVFVVKALDRGRGHRGSATGRVRFIGQTTRVDVAMLGRGEIRGRVTYEDGSVPSRISIIGVSPVFHDGRRARIDLAGNYDIGDLPVGVISLSAQDDLGNFALATVEIAAAGAVVSKDLVVLRRPDQARGDLRGGATLVESGAPAADAWVALYVGGQLVGVRRADREGRFDFGTVPAGLAELEAFAAESGRAAARVQFELRADRTNEVALLLRDDRGTIEGHVYRQGTFGFSPVGNATVYNVGTPFHTTTDASGFYRLENVFAGTPHVAAADPVTRREARGSVSLASGQTATLDLVLPAEASGSVAGIVLDGANRPVVGALVHLEAGDQHWFREATSDLEGRFSISGLVPRTYRVHAIRGALGGSEATTIRFPGDTATVTVRFKTGSIRGTVKARNENGTLLGVRSLVRYRTTVVRLGLVGLDLQSREIETDANGNFQIGGALEGAYTLTVFNSFHGQRTVEGQILQHGQVAQHDVIFERNGAIFGRVLDHDGVTPISGAVVALREHPSFGDYEVTSGADGSYRFDLVPPAGMIGLEVSYSNGVVTRPAWAFGRFTQFGQQLEIDLVLSKLGSVSGRVEDGGGDPVAGAAVRLVRYGRPSQLLQQETGPDGGFSFANVFAGVVSIQAQSAALGGLGGQVTAEIVREGDEPQVVVKLESVGALVGRVLSPVDGSPVVNAAVAAYLNDLFFVDNVSTDGEGRYRIDGLRMGNYVLHAFDPRTGRRGRKAAGALTAHAQLLEAEVILEARGEVFGHVRQADAHTPVSGATVALRSESLAVFVTYGTSDADGGFDFPGIAQGPFSLFTREPGGRRVAGAAGAITHEGERVERDLILERQGAVEGRVLAPLGQPDGPFAPSNTLIYQDGQLIGATLDNPFRFERVISGRDFELVASEPGGRHVGRARGRVEDQGQVVPLDVRMYPIGQVTVRVENASGGSVAGADVTLAGITASGSYQSFSGNTGGDEVVSFIDVDAGELHVTARSPQLQLGGYVRGLLSVDGETVNLVVRLESAGVVRGLLLRADGTGPAIEALVVLRSDGRTFYRLTDSEGRFTFEAVPLGAFTVDFQEHEGIGQLRRFGVVASANQEVDFGQLRLDDSDPFIVSIEPANGSVGVSRQPSILVRFSEVMDRASIEPLAFQLWWSGFNGLGLGFTWEEGDRAVRLSTPRLENFTNFSLTIRSGMRDLAGRSTRDRLTWSFQTIDDEGPAVVSVTPPQGAVQVNVDSQLRVQFDEPIEPLSLSGASLTLTDATAGVGVTTTFTVEAGSRFVLITPAEALVSEHQYVLRVMAVRDRFGNPQTGIHTSSFRTVDAAGPTIALSAPEGPYFEGGTYDVAAVAVDSPDLASVLFFRGDQLLGEDSSAPFAVAYEPHAEDVAAGLVELAAVGKDQAGNSGPRAALSRQIHPDGPPRITIEATPIQVFTGDTVTFSTLVEDAGGLAEIRVTASGAASGTFVLSSGGATSQSFVRNYATPVQPSVGSYFVRLVVRATDLLGKVTEVQRSVPLIYDDTPPEVVSYQPADGTVLAADVPVMLQAVVTDQSAVRDVFFTFDGRSFRDDSPPYRWTTRTPAVSTSSVRGVELVATDRFGNRQVVSWNLVIQPLDPEVPVARILCPASGDGYVSGFAVPVQFRFSDDLEVVRYRILVEGVSVVDTPTTRVNGNPVRVLEGTWIWNPPTGSSPGDTISVVVEGFDAEGRVGRHEIVLRVPDGDVLAGTRNLGSDFEGQPVVLAAGTYTATAPLQFGDLTLLSGAVLRPRALETLTVTVTDELRVGCGAAIDASALGFAGGTSTHPEGFAPAGVRGSATDAGGSHGGLGEGWQALRQGKGGEVYDSVARPTLPGGGGGFDGQVGKRGGGVVHVVAAALTLEGSIRARGESAGSSAPSGGGGSILLDVGSIAGGGFADVSGGDVTTSFGGPGVGGGGRIALYAQEADAFDFRRQLRAWGARFPVAPFEFTSPGTVYTKIGAQQFGGLYVFDGGRADSPPTAVAPTPLPALGAGTVATWTIEGADVWITCVPTCRIEALGAWLRLSDASAIDLGSYQVVGFDPLRGLRLAGAAGLTTAVAAYRGEYRFDHLEVGLGAGLWTRDPLRATTVSFAGHAGLSGSIAAGSVTVPAGATVGAAPTQSKIELDVEGALTVEEGGAIDVSGQGFAGGDLSSGNGRAPLGVRGSPDAWAGSHGGRGINFRAPLGDRSGGDVYGSVVAPHEPGGGGGGGAEIGASGGGVVDLSADQVFLDGEILARGARSNFTVDGGAGGSIWIRARRLAGPGLIDASGGQPEACAFSGLGAGGRVALHVGDLTAFGTGSQARAWSAWHRCAPQDAPLFGTPGTVLIRDSASTYGRLRIDPGEKPGGGARTPPLEVELPALGAGELLSATASGSDLWVVRGERFAGAWLGAWMTLRDAAGVARGTFEVVELDNGGRARVRQASHLASSAVRYSGEYRFDAIEVVGDAGLWVHDPVKTGSMSAAGAVRLDGELLPEVLTLRAGSVARPRLGSYRLELSASQRLIVESGARIDVSALGFAPGSTQPGVRPSQEDAGGSHGGVGEGTDGFRGVGRGGDVYGSVVYPNTAGGGGYLAGWGNPGGGAVSLRAPEIVLEGDIVATDGGAENAFDWFPRGAGGSVLLEAGTLAGSGRIDASGSTASGPVTRPSGGGRVALHVEQFLDFQPTSQVDVTGGWNAFVAAGAGTLFVRSDGEAYGRLVLDGGRTGLLPEPPLATSLPVLGAGAVAGLATLDGLTWVSPSSGSFGVNWPGAWLVLLDASGNSLGGYEVKRVDAAGRAGVLGAVDPSGVVGYRGEHRFESIDVRNGAGFASSTAVKSQDLVVRGANSLQGPISVSGFTVATNGSVQVPPSTTRLDVVANSVVVASGASIDLSGRGYGSKQAPPTVRAATDFASGSHGGVGAVDSRNGAGTAGVAGAVFDSPIVPAFAGGGGAPWGFPQPRAAGGGVLTIEADSVRLDGALISRGLPPFAGEYSGSGGTIVVRANTLTGSGTVDASVGVGGLGGGGRVALDVGLFVAFDPMSQATAHGSCTTSLCAGAGSVFHRSVANPMGTLLLSQQGAPGGATVVQTPMPTIGSGTVGSALADPADPSDVWVSPLDPSQLFGHGVEGAFLRFGAADFRILALSADRRSALLDGAASVAQVGESWSGLWKFGAVFVRGRANYQFLDRLEAPVVAVEPGSQLLVP